MRAGKLDRLVQFQRAPEDSSAFGPVDGDFEDLGTPVWAMKTDVSDGERARAGIVEGQLMTRFKIRWSPFSSGITAADRLVCEGVTYNVTGIKEAEGRREWLEVSATARAS